MLRAGLSVNTDTRGRKASAVNRQRDPIIMRVVGDIHLVRVLRRPAHRWEGW